MNAPGADLSSAAPPRSSHFPGLDAAALISLCRREPESLSWRNKALRRYLECPMPSESDALWNRSPMRHLVWADFPPVEALPWREETVAHPWASHFGLIIAVGPDAVTVDDRGGWLRRGMALRNAVQPLDGNAPDPSNPWMAHPNLMPPDKLDFAIAAFYSTHLELRVSNGLAAEPGVLVLYRPAPGRLLLPQVSIRVESGSRVQITECAESGSASESAMILARRTLRVEEDAHATLTQAQLLNDASYWIGRDETKLGRHAQAVLRFSHTGARIALTRTLAAAAAPGAKVEYRGFVFGDGIRETDLHTAQVHGSPDTASHLLYKQVLTGKSVGRYRGVIAAARGAIRTDAYQKNQNLVLSPEARAESHPGLLIDADDLKCSHGATMGGLDPDALFYLRTRGIPEAAARNMLIEAFSWEITEDFGLEPLRTRILERVASGLSRDTTV